MEGSKFGIEPVRQRELGSFHCTLLLVDSRPIPEKSRL
jgi:hypothetical protein